MIRAYKRENFDVTPEQEAEIDCLQELIKASSRKDAVLTAVRLALHVATEVLRGNKLFLGTERGTELRRLVLLELEVPNHWQWKYLIEIAHPWKRQLFIKGRKLPAAAVWTSMLTNKLSGKEAADNWELPTEAIDEIVEYCEANKALIQMEAAEEGRRLAQKGIQVEPQVAR